ncbi:hypothetical protein KGY79_05955 [Candidatus Bipolaricaulota bacterium]|nr:hypothetical protein [Candidatus Bipolaricaulota bacterium]
MKRIANITFLLLLSFSFLAFGSFSGNWKSTLSLSPQLDPQTASISAFSSQLYFNYAADGISVSSTSTFDLNTFSRQSFGLGLEPGLLDLNSTISFYAPESRLDYWKITGDTVIAGLGITNVFLVEYMDEVSGYGAGNKLVLSGDLSDGVTAEITSYFGLEEDLVEQEGWQEGSGYDIAVFGPNGEKVSMLEYETTEVEIVGQQLDCCKFDLLSQFSADDGFNYALFNFLIKNDNFPLSFDTGITFTSEKKHVSLTPQLNIGWSCFSLYTGFIPPTVDTSTSKLKGFKVKGFGINSIKIGNVKISSLTALGDGVLWKNKAAGSDIYLRAEDYVLEPDPIEEVYYKEVTYGYDKVAFNSVFSIEASQGIDLGIDFYSEGAKGGKLFDLGLVTGEAEYTFSRQFSIGFGTSLFPGQGIDRIDLVMDYSF